MKEGVEVFLAITRRTLIWMGQAIVWNWNTWILQFLVIVVISGLATLGMLGLASVLIVLSTLN